MNHYNTADTDKKSSGFLKVYFIILAVAIILLVISMIILYIRLNNYENAQPKYVAEEVFKKHFKDPDYDSLVEMSKIKSKFESPADYFEKNYGECDLKYINVALNQADKEAYPDSYEDLEKFVVKAQLKDKDNNDKIKEVKISSFMLKKTGRHASALLGLLKQDYYKLESITMYYPLNETVTIKAPVGSDVRVNGVLLGDDYIVESGALADISKGIPEDLEKIYMSTYFVNGLMEKPKVEVSHDTLDVSDINYDEVSCAYTVQVKFMNNEELSQEFSDYVLKAAKEYAKYMQADSSFGNIKGYFDPESTLYQSVRNNQNFVWEHNGYDFKDEQIGEFYSYNEETFSCRVKFTQILHMKGREDYFENIDLTLFLHDINGTYKIFALKTNG